MKKKTDITDLLSDLFVKDLLGIQTETEQEETTFLCHEYQIQKPETKQLIGEVEESCRQDWEKAWRVFQGKTRRKHLRIWWRVAAVLLLFLGSGIFIYIRQKEIPTVHLTEALQIQPVSSKAIITLADGGQIELKEGARHLVEADGTRLQAEEGELVYAPGEGTGNLLYNTITIPRGGEYRLTLSDGTRVWLNAGSQLRYPVRFTGDSRKVFLQGEAYFEVTRLEGKTFGVQTSKGEIRVWGTSFNVRDYREENKVVTTLESGKVSYVPASGQKEVVLKPGYMLEDPGVGELKPVKVRTDFYCGWKDGKYSFDNLSLEEILNTLERWYDVTVVYQHEKSRNLHFTGDLMRYENITTLLNFIETGGDVYFEIQGKTILVKEK